MEAANGPNSLHWFSDPELGKPFNLRRKPFDAQPAVVQPDQFRHEFCERRVRRLVNGRGVCYFGEKCFCLLALSIFWCCFSSADAAAAALAIRSIYEGATP